jgi:NAD-dependent dihydropyrimidine dehydrogenase PreA subunit
MFSEKALGAITLERDRCTGCGTCAGICPVSVFGELDPEKRTTFHHSDGCFACGACVKQCPEDALSLAP